MIRILWAEDVDRNRCQINETIFLQKQDYKDFLKNLKNLLIIRLLKAYLDQDGRHFKQMKMIWSGKDLSFKTISKLLIFWNNIIKISDKFCKIIRKLGY